MSERIVGDVYPCIFACGKGDRVSKLADKTTKKLVEIVEELREVLRR